jgi:large subunit ribosomal protein L25
MRYQTLNVKSRDVAAQKFEGVPAILSRHGKESMPMSVDGAELQRAVRHCGVGGIIELVEDGGGKHLGMLKELQWHPLSRKLQHASFQEVQRDQVVSTTVPVVFVGEPKAVADKSGQFIKNSESLEIHGKVSDLPDHVTVDVSEMTVGDVLSAAGIALPQGITAVHPDTAICTLTTPTVVEIEVPTAETDAVGAAATVGEETEGSEEGKD